MGEMAALSGLPNAFILGAGAASSRVAGVNCEVCMYTVHKHIYNLHTQYIVYVFMYMCTSMYIVYMFMYMCTSMYIVYMFMYMCTSMYIVYMFMYMCTSIYIVYVFMYMCTSIYIVYVFMYMCTEYVHCICVVSQMIPNAKVSTDSCGSSNNCTHIAKVSTEVSSTLIQT